MLAWLITILSLGRVSISKRCPDQVRAVGGKGEDASSNFDFDLARARRNAEHPFIAVHNQPFLPDHKLMPTESDDMIVALLLERCASINHRCKLPTVRAAGGHSAGGFVFSTTGTNG